MEYLTDKKFWEDYWNSKSDIYTKIPENYIFSDIFKKIINKKHPSTAIEVGGFPGYYSIYLSKYYNISTSLVDIVIIPQVIRKLCSVNGLSPDTIKCFEADFFSFSAPEHYDLVFSNGFIEHFDDTALLIQKHVMLLNENGSLMITLPNFKSVNGLFQRIFDPENYKKHNIRCMDCKYLRKTCDELPLKDIEVQYYGYFSIWLEENAKHKAVARILRAILFYPLKAFFKTLRWNTKYFAPYIVLTATKSA
jgi:SAM-dependent methyltransferase